MSTEKPCRNARHRAITVTVTEVGDRTHAIARMDWDNHDLVGVGNTRPTENFPDRLSERLSISRALANLAVQLDTCNRRDVGAVTHLPAPTS